MSEAPRTVLSRRAESDILASSSGTQLDTMQAEAEFWLALRKILLEAVDLIERGKVRATPRTSELRGWYKEWMRTNPPQSQT